MEAIESSKRNSMTPRPSDEFKKTTDLEHQLRELQNINKMQSETVYKQETKNSELTDKLMKYKTYRTCFKSSLACLCKFCHQYLPTEVFVDHSK